MAVEKERGCGYRKAGGIYVRGEIEKGIPVSWVPFCTDYTFSRGMAWAESERLFRTLTPPKGGIEELLQERWRSYKRLALMWVGDRYYTKQSFIEEAVSIGVSKRVANIPHDLKPGDPIALGHIKAVPTS